MALVKEYTDIEFLSDLRNIVQENPDARQRDRGSKCGVSAAVVNGFLKRCLERGWIATKNLNIRKLQYMLTAKGVEELTKRSLSFMKRNFAELSNYKKNIDEKISEVSKSGKNKVVLYGRSDVDFLIEESALSYGMMFEKRELSEMPGGDVVGEFAVIGEDELEYTIEHNGVKTVYALVM